MTPRLSQIQNSELKESQKIKVVQLMSRPQKLKKKKKNQKTGKSYKMKVKL